MTSPTNPNSHGSAISKSPARPSFAFMPPPIPHLGDIAVHTWLVIKSANDARFDRWEVWQTAAGPYGHLRLNLMPPESDVGAGGTYIVAELIGPDAEQIVNFIPNTVADLPLPKPIQTARPKQQHLSAVGFGECVLGNQTSAKAVGKVAKVME
ncbi:MAG: DUF3750 domain-containing protein [Planctomycetes bacterium]|nr:DUF3750 domain-containing protein [Planctomycetota bacterium]